jgi:hypothetical protein
MFALNGNLCSLSQNASIGCGFLAMTLMMRYQIIVYLAKPGPDGEWMPLRDSFEHILWQCIEAGLVDGSKLFVDSSLIDADASNHSVVDTRGLKKYLNKSYRRLEERLDDLEDQKTTPANSRYITFVQKLPNA